MLVDYRSDVEYSLPPLAEPRLCPAQNALLTGWLIMVR